MSAENVTIKFLDKKFKIQVTEPNQVDRILWVSGTEARHIFNKLDEAINIRPRSEDDRLAMEEQASHGDGN
jgi:hypothetical protein